MDRAILLHLDRIEPSRRKDETQFWLEFEQKKADTGRHLQHLVAGNGYLSEGEAAISPAHGGFCQVGICHRRSVEAGGDDFLKSYADNISKQNEEIILSNTLIIAILKEMNEKTLWEGTIKTVYERLVEIAAPDKHDPTFPKTEAQAKNAS